MNKPADPQALHARGHQLAVATGKSRVGLDRALKASGLGPMFAATRCADETFSKPHPQMLLDLMDTLMTDPERTLMIGDTTHDTQMAANAGTRAVAVTYGAHPREELAAAGPHALVESVAELGQWLLRHG